MSEQKLISPLLDGFAMGNPMSDHDGVRSCPAIKENTEKKYIVKIVSVPESQVQMDALLLAGAYKDPADAMDYYKELAEDVVKEAEILQRLSKLEGFLPYEGWQIEPITRRRLGYEVYLLSSYKRSLEKYLHRNPVTHLEALNLSLDMCSALSVCRQAGFLYVNLKPSNIYMSERKEYRIGDLGFLSLDALSYATIPNKYRSAYTPPEFADPMAPVNTTADTYALGMILYQLYNDSQLPSRDHAEDPIPSPINADYELAEIILKAIHPDPQQRWEDPSVLGQALVSYMQRNVVNDVPITPHTPLEIAESASVEEPAPKQSEDIAKDSDSSENNSENESQEDCAEAEENPPVSEAECSNSAEAETSPSQTDESEPQEEDADLLQPHEMSDELSHIVAKADDLIAHETPQGVVIPEIPELPDPFAFATEDSDEIDDSGIPLDPIMDEVAEELQPVAKKKKKKSQRFISPERKRRVRRFFRNVLFLIILTVVGFCGYLYYQMFYLQPVHAITIDGTDQQMTVSIDTEIDESLIHVICTDSYGNIHTGQPKNGQVSFQDLLPDTAYTIELQMDGFHKLSGETSAVFTTDANTKIVSFTAVTGPEDGSAVLNFTVDGDEPKEWTVVCTANGESDIRESFTGHTFTITGLTVGKVYTFTLLPDDDLTLNGTTAIEFMASRLILAENFTITSENGTDMTVSWKAPGDVVVDSWDVRCYNIRGFEAQFTVNEPKAMIPSVDLSAGYTIEVTAAGMTQPSRTNITENPVTITAFTEKNTDNFSRGKFELSWSFTGDEPQGGWLVMYTIDGSSIPHVVKCEKPSAVISPIIPGATYRFNIQAADGSSVLNNVYRIDCAEAASFDQHRLKAENVTVQLLKTPEDKNWSYETISNSVFTDTFTSGDKMSLVLHAPSPFYLPGSETHILYVFRDTHGNVISDLVYQHTISWKSIWSGGDAKTGELDIPIAPTKSGSYVLDLYMDGMAMAHLPLTVQ